MNTKLHILFWVRSSKVNSKGLSPLMMRLTLSGDKKDLSTGFMVNANLWISDKKKLSTKHDGADRINKYILSSDKKINDIYYELERSDKPISTDILKNLFTGKDNVNPTLLGEIDRHNKQFRDKIDNDQSVTESTLSKFELFRDKISVFISYKYSRKDLFISEIDYSFVDDFKSWLLQYGHHSGLHGISADSATGHLKKLNKITNNLFKRGQIKLNPFIDISLKWSKPDPTVLTMDELQRLEALNLIGTQQIVLDRFIAGCYTGMAHSDISAAHHSDIKINFADGEKWIVIHRAKTDEVCKIPIFPPTQRIIEKYNEDSLFPEATLQSCNLTLKEIALLANINKNLTTHVARHTFATMAQDFGMDLEAVAKILGHSDSKTTKTTYARSSNRFVSDQVKSFTEKRFGVLKIKTA